MQVASWGKNEEFLATVSANHVIRPQRCRDTLNYCHQRRVSCAVPIVIIDFLEVVHVSNDYTECVAFASAAREFPTQHVPNCTPVQDPGQRIMLSMKTQRFLRLQKLGFGFLHCGQHSVDGARKPAKFVFATQFQPERQVPTDGDLFDPSIQSCKPRQEIFFENQQQHAAVNNSRQHEEQEQITHYLLAF